MTELVVYDCMLFFMQAARPERVRETFQLIDRGRVSYCLSAEVLAEIQNVLTRPKHRRQFPQLTAQHVAAFLDRITARSHFVASVPEIYAVNNDPKDSKYVNLALAAGAAHLVTRDHHLLDLNDPATMKGGDFVTRFPKLKIVQPAAFVKIFENPRPSNESKP